MEPTASRNDPLPFTTRTRHVSRVSATKEVIEFAKKNGGVFSTQEAVALGLPKSTLQRRIADGIFVRVARGVLALPGTATRSDVRMRAALRILGAVVSHESAARIHGFEPIGNGPPNVTVSHRGTHTFPGVIVHQTTDLLEEHIQELNGMRVTTPLRTLVDLSKVTGIRRFTRVVENALVAGLVEFDELVELTMALSRKGKIGMKRMRRVLERLSGEALSESDLERLLIGIIVDGGLPEPIKQFRAPWLKPLNGRIDLAYPDHQIVIEGDGRRWHGTFDAFEADRSRDNAAQIAGWIVIRVTWRMIKNEPSKVLQTVKAALESRGW